MLFELFQNGSDKVNRRLLIIELLIACTLVAISTIQGLLPSQDWIPQPVIKIAAFVLAVFAAIGKAAELFFSKSAALYVTGRDQNHGEPDPKPQAPAAQ